MIQDRNRFKENIDRTVRNTTPLISYDDYDYMAFWKGRDYENESDKFAVCSLLDKLPYSFGAFADIGGGAGRMMSIYNERAESITIIDPSIKQLEEARRKTFCRHNISFNLGIVENIPFPDEFFNTALCVRVFHYVLQPREAIREIHRTLKVGGCLILEIPNKNHFKNNLKRWFVGNHDSSNKIFLNHDPEEIETILCETGFKIIEKRSVSNFRSPIIKKLVPLRFLLFFERVVQKPLSAFWFGPSVYFLARRIV